MDNEIIIKFYHYGDAYIAHRELFLLGCSKDYVSYYDLIKILNDEKLPYEIRKNIDIFEKGPITPTDYMKEVGWTNGYGIELEEAQYNSENMDIWYLKLPKFKKFKED